MQDGTIFGRTIADKVVAQMRYIIIGEHTTSSLLIKERNWHSSSYIFNIWNHHTIINSLNKIQIHDTSDVVIKSKIIKLNDINGLQKESK